jgi:hypothetical protein
MALTINHGPLPSDGTSVNPATFLEAWINATVILDLSAENFDTGEGGISFVVSQTDAPASSVRTPGMFWFERGAGRMWIWDALDAPSELTFASDFNRYRGGHEWIGISRGKENWCIATKDIPKGAVCYMAHTDPNILTTYSASIVVFAEPDDEQRRWHSPHPARFYWFVDDKPAAESGTSFVSEIAFIALETANSGAIFRTQEFGWCELLAHSGTTGSAAYAYVTDSGVSESSFLFPGAWITQSTNPGRMFFATFTDSSATSPTDVWLRSGFKQHFPPWGIARERV